MSYNTSPFGFCWCYIWCRFTPWSLRTKYTRFIPPGGILMSTLSPAEWDITRQRLIYQHLTPLYASLNHVCYQPYYHYLFICCVVCTPASIISLRSYSRPWHYCYTIWFTVSTLIVKYPNAIVRDYRKTLCCVNLSLDKKFIKMTNTISHSLWKCFKGR